MGRNDLKKSPRHAVCCAVLNLLSQDGYRPRNFALAEAYRVATVDKEPFLKRVGSKREVQNHGHSRVIFLIPQFKTTVQRNFFRSNSFVIVNSGDEFVVESIRTSHPKFFSTPGRV